jgi:hypothetical protein
VGLAAAATREHLDIYSAFIHQRQPMLPKIVEPLLDFTSTEPARTLSDVLSV